MDIIGLKIRNETLREGDFWFTVNEIRSKTVMLGTGVSTASKTKEYNMKVSKLTRMAALILVIIKSSHLGYYDRQARRQHLLLQTSFKEIDNDRNYSKWITYIQEQT